MPQICDMGPIILLPFLRIFYRPLKIRRLRPGLNPRTWVSEASTLPLHHRSRLSKNIKIRIYITTILPVAGCETWSLTLREERRLRLFENTVLRKIFGAERNEVTWEWRTLLNEELYDLYCSSNIIRVVKTRRMRWAGHVARMGR